MVLHSRSLCALGSAHSRWSSSTPTKPRRAPAASALLSSSGTSLSTLHLGHTSIGDVGGQAIAYAILGEAPPGSIGGSDHAAADEAASQAIADLVDAAQAAAEASLEAAEGPKRSSASPLAVV